MPVDVLADLLRRADEAAAAESAATVSVSPTPSKFMPHLQAPAAPAPAPAAPTPLSPVDDMIARLEKTGKAPDVALIGPEEFGLPPKHLWAKMGKIGVGESFERQGWQEGVVERAPFAGEFVTAKRLYDVYQASKTLKAVTEEGHNIGELWRRYKAHPTLERDPIVQETAAALKVAMPFYYEAEMANERGVSIPAKAAQVLADLVPFAAEFAVTGGLAAPARAAVKGGVETVAKKAIGATAARLVGGLAGAATSAAVRTAASPGMVMESLVRRRLPTGFHITDKGDLEITEPTEGAAMAVAKAFGDVFVEQFTEESGVALAKGAKYALSPFARIPGATETANKLRGAIRDAWVSMVPGRTGRQFAKRAFSRAGFDGLLEEMGEERLGEVMRSAFNIQGTEKDDPRTMLQRYRDALPGGEQLLVEALAFSVPGAARAGLGTFMDARGDRKVRSDPNVLAVAAEVVSRTSDNPTLQRYAEKVKKDLEAGNTPERGLANKVIDAGLDQVEKLAEERPAATEPAAAEAAPAPVIIPAEQQQAAIVPAEQAATPQPVAAEEVQGRAEELSVPPTEQVSEPAPAAANITIDMPREEAPAPTAAEAPVRMEKLGDRDFEASVRVSEAAGAEHPDVVGISIQDAPNGRYVARLSGEEGSAEASLPTLIALQLSEMTDAERIQTLKMLEPEMGEAGVKEVVRAFVQAAPRLARRSRVPATWGMQGPPATAEAGGIAAVQVQELFEKYRKLMPKGVLNNLLRDWVSWKQLNKGGASAEVLRSWVVRHQAKPAKAEYIGEVAKELTDKQLRDYIDALKNRMDGPTASILAKMYRGIASRRTPGEISRFLEAVNLAVEKHNHAVAVARLRAIIKDIKQEQLLPEYQDRLDALLKDVAERKPTPAKLQWAIGVMQAAEREGPFYGPFQSDIDSAREVLRRAEGKDLSKMTHQELDNLGKAIAQVANNNWLKKKMLTERRGRTFAGILAESVSEVSTRLGSKYAEKEGQRNVRKAMSGLLNLLTLSQLSHETMIHILGGNQSTVYDVLMRKLREGENETVTVWTKAMDRFRAALAAEGLTIRDAEKWSDVVGKPGQGEEVRLKLESGKTAVLTVGEAMELLLHTWDMDTLKQLRDSKGIVMGQSTTTYEVTGGDLETFNAQMQAEHPEAFRLAKAMGDILNGELRYELNKAWRKHHFYEVATKTDYWPRRRVKSDENKEDDPNEMMANWRKHFLDDMGIFQERTGTKQAVIIHDAFSTFLRHVNRTATYIGKAAPHADAVRLLESPEFQATVKANIKYGKEWLDRMEQAVGDWAGVDIQEREAYTGLVKKFIRGAHIGVLGLKPQIVLYQVISAINVLNEMGAKYMAAEVNKDSASQIRDEMHKYAPVLWMRVTGSGHNIITPGAGDSGMNEMFGAKERLLTRVGLDPIHWGDNQVMYRIWQASKAEGAEKGLVGDELMRYVGERATEVVDRTQPTYDPLTISGLQNYARKNPLLALMLLYRSQSNKNINMAVRAIADWTLGTDKRLGVMLGKVFLPIVGNALGVSIIAALYKMLKGEVLTELFGAPDDEDRAANTIKDATWGTVERTLTQWMLAGDAINLLSLGARTAAEGKPVVLVPERQNVMTSAGNDAVATVYYITKALMDADEQYKTGPRKYDSKAPASWISAAERAARLASVVGGVPTQELTSIGARMLREVK